MARRELAFLLVVALTTQGANAASLTPREAGFKESAVGLRLMQETHGCHYTCECGPLTDFGC